MRHSKKERLLERLLYERMFGPTPQPTEDMVNLECKTCGFTFLMPIQFLQWRVKQIDPLKCEICQGTHIQIPSIELWFWNGSDYDKRKLQVNGKPSGDGD